MIYSLSSEINSSIIYRDDQPSATAGVEIEKRNPHNDIYSADKMTNISETDNDQSGRVGISRKLGDENNSNNIFINNEDINDKSIQVKPKNEIPQYDILYDDDIKTKNKNNGFSNNAKISPSNDPTKIPNSPNIQPGAKFSEIMETSLHKPSFKKEYLKRSTSKIPFQNELSTIRKGNLKDNACKSDTFDYDVNDLINSNSTLKKVDNVQCQQFGKDCSCVANTHSDRRDEHKAIGAQHVNVFITPKSKFKHRKLERNKCSGERNEKREKLPLLDHKLVLAEIIVELHNLNLNKSLLKGDGKSNSSKLDKICDKKCQKYVALSRKIRTVELDGTDYTERHAKANYQKNPNIIKKQTVEDDFRNFKLNMLSEYVKSKNRFDDFFAQKTFSNIEERVRRNNDNHFIDLKNEPLEEIENIITPIPDIPLEAYTNIKRNIFHLEHSNNNKKNCCCKHFRHKSKNAKRKKMKNQNYTIKSSTEKVTKCTKLNSNKNSELNSPKSFADIQSTFEMKSNMNDHVSVMNKHRQVRKYRNVNNEKHLTDRFIPRLHNLTSRITQMPLYLEDTCDISTKYVQNNARLKKRYDILSSRTPYELSINSYLANGNHADPPIDIRYDVATRKAQHPLNIANRDHITSKYTQIPSSSPIPVEKPFDVSIGGTQMPLSINRNYVTSKSAPESPLGIEQTYDNLIGVSQIHLPIDKSYDTSRSTNKPPLSVKKIYDIAIGETKLPIDKSCETSTSGTEDPSYVGKAHDISNDRTQMPLSLDARDEMSTIPSQTSQIKEKHGTSFMDNCVFYKLTPTEESLIYISKLIHALLFAQVENHKKYESKNYGKCTENNINEYESDFGDRNILKSVDPNNISFTEIEPILEIAMQIIKEKQYQINKRNIKENKKSNLANVTSKIKDVSDQIHQYLCSKKGLKLCLDYTNFTTSPTATHSNSAQNILKNLAPNKNNSNEKTFPENNAEKRIRNQYAKENIKGVSSNSNRKVYTNLKYVNSVDKNSYIDQSLKKTDNNINYVKNKSPRFERSENFEKNMSEKKILSENEVENKKQFSNSLQRLKRYLEINFGDTIKNTDTKSGLLEHSKHSNFENNISHSKTNGKIYTSNNVDDMILKAYHRGRQENELSPNVGSQRQYGNSNKILQKNIKKSTSGSSKGKNNRIRNAWISNLNYNIEPQPETPSAKPQFNEREYIKTTPTQLLETRGMDDGVNDYLDDVGKLQNIAMELKKISGEISNDRADEIEFGPRLDTSKDSNQLRDAYPKTERENKTYFKDGKNIITQHFRNTFQNEKRHPKNTKCPKNYYDFVSTKTSSDTSNSVSEKATLLLIDAPVHVENKPSTTSTRLAATTNSSEKATTTKPTTVTTPVSTDRITFETTQKPDVSTMAATTKSSKKVTTTESTIVTNPVTTEGITFETTKKPDVSTLATTTISSEKVTTTESTTLTNPVTTDRITFETTKKLDVSTLAVTTKSSEKMTTTESTTGTNPVKTDRIILETTKKFDDGFCDPKVPGSRCVCDMNLAMQEIGEIFKNNQTPQILQEQIEKFTCPLYKTMPEYFIINSNFPPKMIDQSFIGIIKDGSFGLLEASYDLMKGNMRNKRDMDEENEKTGMKKIDFLNSDIENIWYENEINPKESKTFKDPIFNEFDEEFRTKSDDLETFNEKSDNNRRFGWFNDLNDDTKDDNYRNVENHKSKSVFEDIFGEDDADNDFNDVNMDSRYVQKTVLGFRSKRNAGWIRRRRFTDLDTTKFEDGLRNLPSFKLLQGEVYALPNEPVTIFCTDEKITTSCSYEWKTGDGSFLESSRSRIAKDNELHFSSVRFKDSGTYSCTVTRETQNKGKPQNYHHTLTIVEIPFYTMLFALYYNTSDVCQKTDLDVLSLYLPDLMAQKLCAEDKLCSVTIEEPHCFDRKSKGTGGRLAATGVLRMAEYCPTPMAVAEACGPYCRRSLRSSIAAVIGVSLPAVILTPVLVKLPYRNEVYYPVTNMGRQWKKSISSPIKDSDQYHSFGSKMRALDLDLVVGCPAGFKLKTDSKICLACTVDHYSSFGDVSCHRCPHGTYAPSVGSHECLTCTDNTIPGCMLTDRSKVLGIIAGVTIAVVVVIVICHFVFAMKAM